MFQLIRKEGIEKYLFRGFEVLVSVEGAGPSSTVSSVFGFSGVFWGLITVGNQLMTRTAGTVITMNNGPRGSDVKNILREAQRCILFLVTFNYENSKKL